MILILPHENYDDEKTVYQKAKEKSFSTKKQYFFKKKLKVLLFGLSNETNFFWRFKKKHKKDRFVSFASKDGFLRKIEPIY